MQCPRCRSTHLRKNGRKQGKQNYICADCQRQFIDADDPPRTYSDQIKQECLKLYVNGMGFRAIERGHCAFTILRPLLGSNNWVNKWVMLHKNQKFQRLANQINLKRLSAQKKTLIWVWTALNHFRAGILAWVVGDHSAATFKPPKQQVCRWHCYFLVTDGWKVYPCFIDAGDHIVSKTYMTRVESENTRLRHYQARLHRKTLCYSKSVQMLKYSIRLLLYYLKYCSIPLLA